MRHEWSHIPYGLHKSLVPVGHPCSAPPSHISHIILPLFNKTRTGPTLHLWLDGCGGLEILAGVGAGGELYKSYCR